MPGPGRHRHPNGDPNQDMSLEQALKYVEAKEAGKRSASRLTLPHATEASSSYKAKSKVQSKPQPPRDEPCAYCGTRGHGKNAPTRTRRVECPAFGTTCDSCGKDHHFKKVCLPRDHHSPTPVAPYFMASVPWRRQATRIR